MAPPTTHPRRLALVSLTAGLMAAAASLVSIAPAEAATTVVDLGLLPGGSYASARAINTGGGIVGMVTDSAGAFKQARFAGGSATLLASSCCASSLAAPLALNDSGEAVGWGRVYGSLSDPAYWNAAGVTVPLQPIAGSTGTGIRAYDINNSGVIVGSDVKPSTAFGAPPEYHGVVWNRGTLVRDLGFLGQAASGLSNATFAQGINDAGDIVGEAVVGMDRHAFLWRGGAFTDLGPGSALDINSTGLVLGYAPGLIPATWTGTVRKNLPALGGGTTAYGHTVTDLNNGGDIVGFAPATTGPLQDTAVLWRGGKAINLGRAPGGTVSRAYGINDAGQIVGEGNVVAGGPMHALMWTVSGSTATNTTPTATAAATTTTSIRVGGSVTVKGTFTDPDNGPWSYTFTWGNGSTTGTAQTAGSITQSRTFTKAGTYKVTFSVTDAKGAKATSSSITVRVS